jgi:hypothetical protein
MRVNLGNLILGASLSGAAFSMISATPASAIDITHSTHARSGQLSRIWTFFDCRSHSPIGNNGSYGAHGTVTVKFVPQKNCGNAQEPTNEVWYVSPAGFKGLDTISFPFGARSRITLNVTVD